MQDKIKVKEVKLYEGDLYYNYAIVTLTNGEKFSISGEVSQDGKFIVKKKRGSIGPYEMEFGTVAEKNKICDFYLKSGLIEIEDLGYCKFYSLVEEYENAIADAIIEHGKEFNFDIMVDFEDYPSSSIITSEVDQKEIFKLSPVTEEKTGKVSEKQK